MPFQLKANNVIAIRCTGCGRILRGQPVIVKTCCINSTPWVFCSKECYKSFMMRWVRNQDALKSGGKLWKTI